MDPQVPISQGFTEDERGRFIGLYDEGITIKDFVHIIPLQSNHSEVHLISVYGRTGTVL